MTHCKARQYSDQMQCGPCGLTWDVNDPEPPDCNRVGPARARYNQVRGELALGCMMYTTRYKFPRRVTGWAQRGGLLYFHLEGLQQPVLASSCKSC